MSIHQSLTTAYLCWFSKPRADRELFRVIRRNRVKQIVELGIDSIERTVRMLQIATCLAGEGDTAIKYASVDLFDARPDSLPPLTLKRTHRTLAGTGATVRLIPGDVLSGLARAANQLSDTELLIVSSHWQPELLERAWPFVPRMLNDNATVIETRASETATRHTRLTLEQVRQRAETGIDKKSSRTRAA